MIKKLYKTKILVLLIVLLFLILFSITLGAVKIPFIETVKIIISKIKFIGNRVNVENIKDSNIFIVMNIRLPRILMASLVGAILSVVGASYQAIFKNPMADPFVMGVSSGAAFGATLGIILGLNKGILGFGLTSVIAFAGALLTTFLVYNLARVGNKISTTAILLAGIVVSSLLSSGISLMMIFNKDELINIVSWTLGSFNGSSWTQLLVISIPATIGTIFLTTYSKELNAIVLGEDQAQNLGVNVELTKKIILVTASFLAACAVSVSGIIGFVGLIIPHLLRLVFGSDHRILLPVSVIGGSIFLLICDTLARTMLSGIEIPVGIITSLFGGPFFLYLLKRNRSKNLI
ncbi:MAG: iron ABC transporter permease [Firmicutes bacterium]|nr:iron ABC transporter permease [Bacillota bacterium]